MYASKHPAIISTYRVSLEAEVTGPNLCSEVNLTVKKKWKKKTNRYVMHPTTERIMCYTFYGQIGFRPSLLFVNDE